MTLPAIKGPIFEFYMPNTPLLGLLSIPHSGEWIPSEFEPYLSGDHLAYQEDVDFAVNQLVDIEKLTQNGIAVLVARVHRICVDLNRSPDLTILNWKLNTHGKTLVVKEPEKHEVEILKGLYYFPYFEMMKAMITELQRTKKMASIVDLHSMPSKPTDYHLKITPNQELTRPDFCISDIKGLSCEKIYIDYISELFQKQNFKVYQNNPYFGGHITRHIHDQFQNKNNIQIEINRALYMDESKKDLIPSLAMPLKLKITDNLINLFQKFNYPK
jgi:N-formylglutamate amidohydrolase